MSNIGEKKNQQIKLIYIDRTCFSRILLLSLGLYSTFFLLCTIQNKRYIFLMLFSFVILVDTSYICLKRNGIDFKWYLNNYLIKILILNLILRISLSYVAFTIQMLIFFWRQHEEKYKLNNCHLNTANITINDRKCFNVILFNHF